MKIFILALAGLMILTSCAAPTANPVPTSIPHSVTVVPPSYTEPTPLPASTATSTAIPSTPTLTPAPMPEFDRYVGVLLGLDYDPRRIDRGIHGVLTDVFMIYIVDDTPSLSVTQINLFTVSRDAFVQVPCSPTYDGTELAGLDRINAAYAHGGFDCVSDTVEANFGLEVNAPIGVIDMAAFTSLVDKLGGVELRSSGDYTERCGTLIDEEIVEYEWIEDEWYEMDGVEALCYVRGRTSPLGDLERNFKMTDMVWAIYGKAWQSLKALDIEALLAFYETYKSYVITNAELSDMELFIKLVTDGGTHYWHRILLSLDEVEFFKTPTGASVLMPKVNLTEWLNEQLNGVRYGY